MQENENMFRITNDTDDFLPQKLYYIQELISSFALRERIINSVY